MYGKFHSSTFTGSMRGSGPVVFAVWAYVVSNTNQHSVIEINPDVVAFLLGCTPAEVEQAIETLCAPDPKSRCKDNDGRRLLKEGEFQYFVPTHKHYREMKTTEEKREYNRVKKQEERQRKSNVERDVKNVKDVNTSEAEAEALSDSYPESEAKADLNSISKNNNDDGKKVSFSMPSLEEFTAYYGKAMEDVDLGEHLMLSDWLLEQHSYCSDKWAEQPVNNWKSQTGRFTRLYRDYWNFTKPVEKPDDEGEDDNGGF